MKTKIKLHGIISQKYGSTFEFYNIQKPIDGLKAIETINNGFMKYIQDQGLKGMNYEMIVDGQTENCFSISDCRGSIKVIEIAPCISGQVPAAWFVAMGFSATTAATMATFATALVVSIAVAGITYLLTPVPENKPQEMEAAIKGQSFIFSSPNNVAQQGQPIPVGYGRLRVGSQVIMSDLKNQPVYEVSNPFISQGEDNYINLDLILNKFKENV